MNHVLSAVVVVTGLALPSTVVAQDPVKSNPGVYHLVFENDTVRVLHVALKGAGKTTMHEHPDNVIVALADAKVRFTGADGKTEEAPLKADQAMWSPAGRHSGENVGPAVEALLVELKGSKAPTGKVSTTRPEMKITPFFDNPRAMAYKATISPNFHEPSGTTHDFDQVVIALGTGDVSVDVEGKVKNQWKRGEVLFIGRGMKHESKNTSGKPLDIITVAIK